MDSSIVIAKTDEAEAAFQEWLKTVGSTASVLEQVAKRASFHHEAVSSIDDEDIAVRAERYRRGVRFTFTLKQSQEAR